MKRRDFLTGLAAFAAQPAWETAAGAPVASAAGNSPFRGLARASENALRDADILILGDGNHFNIGLRRPIEDPGFLGRLSANGVTDLYIEFFKDYQVYANALVSGNYRNDPGLFERSLAQRLEDDLGAANPALIASLRRTITVAAAKGMRVHFADPQPIAEQAALLEALAEAPAGTPEYRMNEVRELSRRLATYDHVIAHDITETRRGKVAVFYGALHALSCDPAGFLSRAGNIDDALQARGLKTRTILLSDENLAAVERTFAHATQAQMPFGRGIDMPDYFYSPARDELRTGDNATRPAYGGFFNRKVCTPLPS